MIGEDVLYLPVRELASRIRTRRLSPVELTEAYLHRSETIGKRLNSYATVTRELAIKEARAAEREIRVSCGRQPKRRRRFETLLESFADRKGLQFVAQPRPSEHWSEDGLR